jgi:hypothetical protein
MTSNWAAKKSPASFIAAWPQPLGRDSIPTRRDHPVYSSFAKHFTLYQITVNDVVTAVKPLPRVHWVIEQLKSWLRGTRCHVSEKHLENYLVEFSYRFNRRFKHRQTTIFDRLLTVRCNTKKLGPRLDGQYYL